MSGHGGQGPYDNGRGRTFSAATHGAQTRMPARRKTDRRLAALTQRQACEFSIPCLNLALPRSATSMPRRSAAASARQTPPHPDPPADDRASGDRRRRRAPHCSNPHRRNDRRRPGKRSRSATRLASPRAGECTRSLGRGASRRTSHGETIRCGFAEDRSSEKSGKPGVAPGRWCLAPGQWCLTPGRTGQELSPSSAKRGQCRATSD